MSNDISTSSTCVSIITGTGGGRGMLIKSSFEVERMGYNIGYEGLSFFHFLTLFLNEPLLNNESALLS